MHSFYEDMRSVVWTQFGRTGVQSVEGAIARTRAMMASQGEMRTQQTRCRLEHIRRADAERVQNGCVT